MLMKIENKDLDKKINFIKNFFKSNPDKKPDYLEDIFDNIETSKHIIEKIYSFLKLEASSVLNIRYIASYSHKNLEKINYNNDLSSTTDEFKNMLKFLINK